MDPEKLKVVELRTELSQRGLDTKGVKSVLVERLRKALEEENADQDDQAKPNANAESIHDATVQDNDERDSARVPQTPKKSSRLSKGAPMMPVNPPSVKKRTRNPRASYSRTSKRTSPKKSDSNDLSRESSPAMSETALQEEIMPEEKPQSPERNEEQETKESSQDIDDEASNSLKVVQEEDETKSIDATVEKEVKVSQPAVTKSPIKHSDTVDETAEKSDDNADDAKQSKKAEAKVVEFEEEISEGAQIIAQNEDTATKVLDSDIPKAIDDECDRTENPETEKIDQEEENVEAAEILSTTAPIKEDENPNISEADAATNDSLDQGETNENENDESKPEDRFTEDQHSLSGNIDDLDSDIVDKQDEQDIEMTEIKHEEDTDMDTKEQDKTDVKDRKRKRSPSPVEDRHESPAPEIIENEPEIDDSALTLSWYDSDLNLVIDKDGFFTATPMHNDDFSYMWAGARASYGFLSGKVYYEAKIVEHCSVSTENEEQQHVLRIGWSAPFTSMQLGEENFSFGYCSTGKKLTNNQFEDYGIQFGKDDIIGCYFDATSENNVVLSYTVNGTDQGTAFNISKNELGDKPLFPHILSKNCSFACNFGQERPWTDEILEGYVSIGNAESQYKIPGPRRPEKKTECEVIMMCGLPACGKTTWTTKHAAEHPQKMYNILGLTNLINKMKEPGLSREEYTGKWETLINKGSRALGKLMEIAPTRRRNYILDQTNVYASAQRRKMKNFCGYQRKAVVLVPSEEEFKLRVVNHKPIDGKETTDSMLLEMKANFRAPLVGDSFDIVDWVELDQEEGNKLLEKYNKEGKDAGYGYHQTNKRARIDSRAENVRESRNTRGDSREYRDRRGNNYSERNRNAGWRGGGGGGGSAGWRDRPQRGGHVRHGGGYGPPMPWRGRGAPIPLVHRGMDRRGGNMDRRTGNDRGRAAGSRQGGWGPMGNYQGSQQSVWNQQGNWSGGQSQGGWGQQSNWGSQQWDNWKGYGQGSYNQSSYNQQGYGNGNWNSWNQQYYNQYWGQQQQSGQTTTSGSQAVNKQ